MLYWTDVGTDRIEKASMDGTSRIVLHNTSLDTVYGLALDYDDQILYWADYVNNRIESSYTDGSNRQVIISSGIVDPFGITFYENKLYWTDFGLNGIYTLDLNNSVISQVIHLGNDAYGIQVATEDRQPEGIACNSTLYFIHMMFSS